MSERYRADQVGSLLRPFELIQARAAFSNGQISLDQLRKIEDHAILDALQLQREAGVEVFTDGEYRRGLFLDVLTEAVDGFTTAARPVEWRAPGDKVEIVKGGKVV